MKATSLLALTLGLVAFLPAQEIPEAPVREYCERAARTDPLDAAALHELGRWCRGAGLEDEARECFEDALRIDPDHAGARAALGYRRHGTGWVLGEAASAGGGATPPGATAAGAAPAGAQEAPEAPPAPETGSSGELPAGVPPTAAAPEGPAGAEGPAAATPEAAEARAEAVGSAAEAELARKKEWARAAAETMKITLHLKEDRDFLIHSVHPSGSQEVKILHARLRESKARAAALVGARSSESLWPSKLHAVLLDSELEYERFAELVDSVRYVKNPEGAYVAGDHLVLWKPASPAAALHVGETVLEGLQGTQRWVPGWAREGLAELVAVLVEKDAERYRRHYEVAAQSIETEGESLRLVEVLEEPAPRPRARDRLRSFAVTFVDFLAHSSSALRKVAKKLKSPEAPVPPAEEGEFKQFFLAAFVPFQREALESSLGIEMPKIEARWKAWVLKKAAAYRKAEAQSTEGDRSRRRDRGGREGRGGRDGEDRRQRRG